MLRAVGDEHSRGMWYSPRGDCNLDRDYKFVNWTLRFDQYFTECLITYLIVYNPSNNTSIISLHLQVRKMRLDSPLAYQLWDTQCKPNISHSVRPSPQNKINIHKDRESRQNSSQDPFKCDSHCPVRGHSVSVSWRSTEQGKSGSHRRPLASQDPASSSNSWGLLSSVFVIN